MNPVVTPMACRPCPPPVLQRFGRGDRHPAAAGGCLPRDFRARLVHSRMGEGRPNTIFGSPFAASGAGAAPGLCRSHACAEPCLGGTYCYADGRIDAIGRVWGGDHARSATGDASLAGWPSVPHLPAGYEISSSFLQAERSREASMIVVHAGVFAVGLALVLSALLSAIRTFVVPRGAPDTLTRAVFVTMRLVFDLPSHRHAPPRASRPWPSFAPVTLLTLPVCGWPACSQATWRSTGPWALLVERRLHHQPPLAALPRLRHAGACPRRRSWRSPRPCSACCWPPSWSPTCRPCTAPSPSARPPSPAWRRAPGRRPRRSRCSPATIASTAWSISARSGRRGRPGSRWSRRATPRCCR